MKSSELEAVAVMLRLFVELRVFVLEAEEEGRSDRQVMGVESSVHGNHELVSC